MEKEPLLSYVNRRIRHSSLSPPLQSPGSLSSVPEDDEIITQADLNDRIIFGTPPSASSSSVHVDSLNVGLNSPRRSSYLDSNISCFQESSNLEANQRQPSWLTDPNISWIKTNLHRSNTAPAMAVIKDFDHPPCSNPPQSGSSSIVRQAVLFLILYLACGVGIYSACSKNFKGQETHVVVDALYFCIVTMCTIGYGDLTPSSTSTKLFSIMFVLVGFGFIDTLLSGMVGYVLDLQENYLLKTLKSRGSRDAGRFVIDVKKGRMRIRMKVALALGVVILCISVGVTFMHYVEKLSWLDSFYLSVMSVTTVGYGDRAFNSLPGRIFASIWLLVSTLAVARAFLYFAEARVDKRHRSMTKWVLDQHMTVSQFLAADVDNHGFVSKSEYVIYKLKEMGKVTEKDVLLISKQFKRLDKGNFGKITLADLNERHH